MLGIIGNVFMSGEDTRGMSVVRGVESNKKTESKGCLPYDFVCWFQSQNQHLEVN